MKKLICSACAMIMISAALLNTCSGMKNDSETETDLYSGMTIAPLTEADARLQKAVLTGDQSEFESAKASGPFTSKCVEAALIEAFEYDWKRDRGWWYLVSFFSDLVAFASGHEIQSLLRYMKTSTWGAIALGAEHAESRKREAMQLIADTRQHSDTGTVREFVLLAVTVDRAEDLIPDMFARLALQPGGESDCINIAGEAFEAALVENCLRAQKALIRTSYVSTAVVKRILETSPSNSFLQGVVKMTGTASRIPASALPPEYSVSLDGCPVQ